MLAFSEFFYLTHAGQGRWQIRHRITDEPAGLIVRNGADFDLYNDEERVVARFDSIEHALAGLYADA